MNYTPLWDPRAPIRRHVSLPIHVANDAKTVCFPNPALILKTFFLISVLVTLRRPTNCAHRAYTTANSPYHHLIDVLVDILSCSCVLRNFPVSSWLSCFVVQN